MKELARKTAAATGDIRKRVDGIQHDTAEATGAIKQLSEIADRVSALQQSIASAVEEQSATTRELSGNISQVSQGGADIAKNIVAVAEAAKSASTGAQETLASAKELSRLAAGLQQVIARFTVWLETRRLHHHRAPGMPPLGPWYGRACARRAAGRTGYLDHQSGRGDMASLATKIANSWKHAANRPLRAVVPIHRWLLDHRVEGIRSDARAGRQGQAGCSVTVR